MKIALLGGSFNPPHVGHLMNAYYVLATRPVDQVWLMPVFHHPFEKRLASFEDRVAMCERAVARFAGGLAVTRIEEESPTGRTIDTLEVLLARYPEHRFSLVIGTDVLPDLPRWKDFAGIERRAEVILVARAGYPSERASGPVLPEVSSTEIRAQLERGDSVEGLVPREVIQLIEERGLYRTT